MSPYAKEVGRVDINKELNERIRTRRIRFRVPVGILFILPFIVYFQITSGKATFAGYDHTGINQPLKYTTFNRLEDGDLPLWDEHLDRGMPIMAEGEAGIFYPLNWLTFLPGDFLYKYNIIVILCFSLGGIFFFLWIRNLGVDPLIALLMSVGFQQGTTIHFNKATMNIMEGYILTPLLMFFVEPGKDNDTPLLRTAGISIIFAMMVFAGQAQYVVYGAMFAYVYVFFRVVFSGKNWLSFLLSMGIPLIAGSILGFALSGIQSLPTLELVPLSERGNDIIYGDFFKRGLWLNPSRLYAVFIFPVYHYSVNHFLPYLSTSCWVGPVAVMVAGYSLRYRKEYPFLVPLLLSGLVFLYLAMGANVPFAGEITATGPLGHFRGHGRLSGYFTLAIYTLMGFGLQRFLYTYFPFKNPERDTVIPPFVGELVLMGLLLIPFIVHRSDYLETKFALMLFAGFIVIFLLGVFIGRKLNSGIPVIVSIVICLLIQTTGFWIMSCESMLWRDRFESQRTAIHYIRDESKSLDEATYLAIRTQASIRFHQRTLEKGIHVFNPGPQDDIDHMGSANTGIVDGLYVCNADLPLEIGEWEKIMHRELWMAVDFTKGPLEKKWANLLWVMGINWIVSENADVDIPGYTRLEDPAWNNRGVPYFIYKREISVLPYSYFRYYETESDNPADTARDSFLEYLNGDNIGSTVFLEGVGRQDLSAVPQESTTIITYTRETPEKIVVNINCESEIIFMLRDQWYPGWSATIDGKDAELIKADFLFKAVKVPAGQHKVVFEYRSTYLIAGQILTSITSIVLLGMILVGRRRRFTY
jgi:hypothetical protein